jgi:hypothetical protein
MFSETCAAPTLRAAKGETCLYSVPDFDTLLVIEYRAVDRAGDMVFGELGRRAHVDDLVKGSKIAKPLEADQVMISCGGRSWVHGRLF